MKKEYLILLLVILVGFFLRFQAIITNSFAFTYDVGRDMLALWDIQFLHKISLIGPTSGLPGVFYGPWWYIILFPFYVIGGGNPQFLTSIIALFGVFTIFLAYTFGKKLGGPFLGLIFAALTSVSAALTALSTQIWSPNIAPIFVILALYCLYEIYSQKSSKLRYFFLLGFLLALISESGIVFGFLFMFGVILSLIFVARKSVSIKSIISFFLGIFVIFSPRIIFEFRHQFLMTRAFINFLASGDSGKTTDLLGIFLTRVIFLFNNFNSAITAENKILGLVTIIFMALTLIAFFKYASEMIKKFIKTSLIIVAVFLLGLVLFRHELWAHYLVGLPIVFILLFAITVNLIGRKLKNKTFSSLIVVLLFLINLNPIGLIYNIGKPLWIGDASVYRNQIEAIDYVYNQAKGNNFKYIVYTPPVHDYTYRYLFKWYGLKKYHYLSSSDSNLAFFILEPDPQFPFRLTEWLKFREKDGVVIKTEKFKSGIIVQTRVH
jgi:4-amino-4-deoxy-L-arabinose transferase-like glycosyltransferase